jgi:hypothetical protein
LERPSTAGHLPHALDEQCDIQPKAHSTAVQSVTPPLRQLIELLGKAKNIDRRRIEIVIVKPVVHVLKELSFNSAGCLADLARFLPDQADAQFTFRRVVQVVDIGSAKDLMLNDR